MISTKHDNDANDFDIIRNFDNEFRSSEIIMEFIISNLKRDLAIKSNQ